MDQRIFDKFRRIVYEKSGISLGRSKEALVAARVGKRMRALGSRDYRDYLQYLLQDKSGDEIILLLDAISTNVTSFFREPDHFDYFSELLSEWWKGGQRRFRFWSAASSTGEEAYSMAMIFHETLKVSGIDIKILATDISTRVLEHCKTGFYEKEKLKTVPPAFRERYFHMLRDGQKVVCQPKNVLRDCITFTRLNLATPPFPVRGPMDAIFCRNVMIYFDNKVRGNLLAELYRILKPNGFLFVGHTESLAGVDSDFKVVKPSVYVKKR